MLNVGDILGGIYEITEKIGSGGGGIIFKANHLRMKKTVAIKLIKDNVKNILENRAEVDLLKNLKNEYLPQVLDFVEDNNDVYTVMEFIEGENFKQLISAGKSFDKKAVNKYAVQLCEAVEYLHSQKPPIIHSDIKPANIMLTPEDKICLIDFNISSVSDGSGAYSVGGSAGYAAPEQFKKIVDIPVETDEFHEETRFISDDDAMEMIDDDATEIIEDESVSVQNPQTKTSTSPSSVIVKNESQKTGKAYIDTRTDIYGIGASLHYIITGRRPVDGKTDFRGINISKKMQRIISKAMAPDPDHRYKSVSEMKKDIDNNGTLKINIKAAIAASVAVVLIAAAAIIYPIVHIELKTSALAYSYGSEFVIEKSSKDKLGGVKVSNKYNATAVSAMQALYEYFNSLPYYERAHYLTTSKAAMEVIEQTRLEHPDKDIQAVTPTSSAFLSGKLDPNNDNEMLKYVSEHYTNYTDEDELYACWTLSDGKISVMFISDDPNMFNALTTDGSTIQGHIGAAGTTAVNDVGLSFDEGVLSWELYDLFDESLFENAFGSPEERIEIMGNNYRISEEELYLGSKNFYGEDLSALTQFTGLKTLKLSSTVGMDISLFPELPTIEEISLRSSDIKNLEGIADKFPNLKTLDISSTEISDLSPLAKLSSLESLDCHYCKLIEDVSSLEKLNSLKSLNISGCELISSLSGISKLSKLETLDVSSLTFEDTSFMDEISKLKNLKSLDLIGVRYINGTYSKGSDKTESLTDISSLKNLTKLEELKISSGDLTDISALLGLTEMKTLVLSSCSKILDFSPIGNMTKLEKLELSSSNGIDANIFENLSNIKELKISMYSKYIDKESKYAYIDAAGLMKHISKMKSLENLSLSHIKFSESDIDVMCGLKSLTYFYIHNSNISAENAKKIEKALPDCNVGIDAPEEFEVWDKDIQDENNAELAGAAETSVTSSDTSNNDMYDDWIFLNIFSGCKDEVTLSETTGNKEIDEFAKLMPNKIYFPENLPLSEVYESGVTKYDDGSVICNVFYDQYYAETESGGIEASTEHIAYKYSIIEKGYHVQNDPEKGGYAYIYTNTGELAAEVINYGDCFCISFKEYTE